MYMVIILKSKETRKKKFSFFVVRMFYLVSNLCYFSVKDKEEFSLPGSCRHRLLLYDWTESSLLIGKFAFINSFII